MDKPDGGYAVGYRKPPKHSRFKKGNSGNPGGKRRPVIASANAALSAVLARRVTVESDEGEARISQLEALTRELVKKAAGGDPRSLKLVFDRISRLEDNYVAKMQLEGMCERAEREDSKSASATSELDEPSPEKCEFPQEFPS